MTVKGSVSSNLDFLVVNDSDFVSTKTKKADLHNVNRMTEIEFVRMLA